MKRIFLPALAAALAGSFSLSARADDQTAKSPYPLSSYLQAPGSPDSIYDSPATANCGGMVASVGAYMVQPRFQGNPAFQVSSNAPGTPVTGLQRDFQYANTWTPFICLGYETSSGLGIRVSWWHFNDGVAEATTVATNGFVTAANPMGLGGGLPTVPGDLISASSSLRLDVYDIDITQRWDPSHTWWLLVGAGVRCAKISQDYSFRAVTPAVGPTGSIDAGHTFNGVGPSLSFQVHRSLHESGIGLYANGRASVLFGTMRQHAALGNIDAAGAFGLAAVNESSHADTMPTLEFEVGADYCRPIGRAQLALQCGFLGQVWFGTGNSSNTDSTFTGNTNNNTNLGFVGVAIRAGLRY